MYGAPAAEGLDAFHRQVLDRALRGHQCTDPIEPRKAIIAGVPGIVYRQTCADTAFVRAAFVKDGFGMVAFVWLSASDEEQAVTTLIEWLDALQWRST